MKIIKVDGINWVPLEEYQKEKHNASECWKSYRHACEHAGNYGFSKAKMNKFYEMWMERMM